MSLASLRTPFVFLDAPRVKGNIAAMAARAKAAGVALRPHAKTHKSPEIARWQIDAGAVGICCAKLGEAEVFADAGVADIRLPYPIHPINADRVAALVDKTRLSFIVDDMAVAKAWSDAMSAAGKRVDVLVKVDVGFHRCGINPDAVDAPDRLAFVASLPGLRFRGLLSHAGHAYNAASELELEYIAVREAEMLQDLATRAALAGVTCEEVSVGSTPTSRFIAAQIAAAKADLPGRITEMRPGNYVFRDRTQVALGAATLDECAMFVEAMVVSRPAPDRVILDSGAKTLALDGCRGFANAPGYGLILAADGTPDETLLIERLNEEHATVKALAPTLLKVGDRVRILPNHACAVANLHDELVLNDDGRDAGRLAVAGRGRVR